MASTLRNAVSGTQLALTAGVVAAAEVAHTTLAGTGVALGMGKSLTDAAPDVSSLTRAAAGVVIEALGGPAARRTSRSGPRCWIEVRGLGGEHAAAIATDVLAAVRGTAGVRAAFLNRALARIVITLDTEAAHVPSRTELCRIVENAESRDGIGVA